MTILNLLKKDHKKVASLLEKLSKTTERAMQSRKNFFNQLEKEFFIHANFEEKYFYPSLKENPETRSIIFEAYEEHEGVKNLLRGMRALSVGKEEWFAKLAVAKEQITTHVREEEEDLFPKVNKLLTTFELNELAKQLKKYKKERSDD